MFRNRKSLIVLSILIAVVLWIYVMGELNPQTTITATNIKVEMVGQDRLEDIGLKAELSYPKQINVTIKGKRSEVYAARNKGITASVDVSSCDYGKNEKSIKINLPEGFRSVHVESITNETAIFTVK